MSDVRITDLPAATSVGETDIAIVDDGATTRRATVGQLLQGLDQIKGSATAPTAAALGVASIAGILWHNEADNHIYKRDQDDTAWIDLIALDEPTGTAFWAGGLPKSTTSTRPAGLTKSGLWVYAVSSSIWQVYLYSGTADILLGTANPSTGAWSPAGQGDTVIAVTASRTLDVNNALYVVDSSSDAVALTLPPGATAGEPYNVRIKWEAGGNAVTYLPSGTDTINHTTGSKSISAVGETVALSVDVDVSPDNWTSVSTVSGMQASNALSEIAALSLQATARTNIGAAAASDVAVKQIVYAEVLTSGATTNVIPLDDTIPQNTEGAEVLTCSITPKSASSSLLIEANWNLTENTNGDNAGAIAALFRDSGANAIAAQQCEMLGQSASGLGATGMARGTLRCKVASGSTSATTIRLRLGPAGTNAGAVAWRWNGWNSSRMLGGVWPISITITEVV